jgi:Pleckstrin homology domain/von Willebrand factor type A domain
VGKDGESWQELECFLFGEMLICIKEKKIHDANGHHFDQPSKPKASRFALKGSILIKKHLQEIKSVPGRDHSLPHSTSEHDWKKRQEKKKSDGNLDTPILTLKLTVKELPCFHLRFQNRNQLELWRRAFLDLHRPDPPVRHSDYDLDTLGTEEDDYRTLKTNKRQSSTNSSYGASKSNNTALTDYTTNLREAGPLSLHVPLDLVVVIPVSSSMQGLKINLLRDTLKFLVQNLGPRDRMGLVTFGSSGGGVPLVGMTTKAWNGWSKILNSLRPVGQKSLRADVVEGANVAMDLLMQRKSNNPISTILLISDSSTAESESVDFVVSRAEAAKFVLSLRFFFFFSSRESDLLTRPSQGWHSFVWLGPHTQAGYLDRALDSHKGMLYLRQGLDDAARMCGRMSWLAADNVTSKRQAQTSPARGFACKILQNQWCSSHNQTSHRERCRGCSG